MEPFIQLELTTSTDFIYYDPKNYNIVVHAPKPIAHSSGVYEIKLPVHITIPDGYHIVVENFFENLLSGVSILQCVYKYDNVFAPKNMRWYTTLIVKVDKKFVVPKLHPLCKLRLYKNESVKCQTSYI